VEAQGRTEIGGRETNQDQFLIAVIEPQLRVSQSSVPVSDCESQTPSGSARYLFAVADGMGGQAAGEFASRLVIETISRRIVSELQSTSTADRAPDRSPVPRLLTVVDECQEALRGHVRHSPHMRGMGTTLTLAYVSWPTAYIVHAGDSRAYLLRGNQARQLTTDHTVAQQLARAAQSDTDIVHSRWDHVLWNVIGGDGRSLNPDSVVLELRDGDQLLLCTDGLMRGLSDEILVQVLHHGGSLDERIDQLVESAIAADGRDNITVVAAQFAAPSTPVRHTRRVHRKSHRTETWSVVDAVDA
jgi:protein phosphatase